MHPAPSVIIFTTLSGLGFGMMVWLGLGFGPSDDVVGPATAFLAMVVAGLGLVASTFHLGNPQRALRAFTQWRSSWLSREGVVSVVLMGVFFLYFAFWAAGERIAWLGWVSAALALLAVVCTAMIYAQLRTVPRWNSPWTAPMFLAYSQAGGVMAVAFAASVAGESVDVGFSVFLLALTALAYLYRRVTQGATLRAAGHTPESATQLGRIGRVRLLESPHSSPNYLMKEMVFRVGRKHAEKLALISVLLGMFAPLFLFVVFRDPAAYGLSPALQAPGLGLALILHLGGAMVSRWLFFAEAEHVVGLYYGQR